MKEGVGAPEAVEQPELVGTALTVAPKLAEGVAEGVTLAVLVCVGVHVVHHVEVPDGAALTLLDMLSLLLPVLPLALGLGVMVTVALGLFDEAADRVGVTVLVARGVLVALEELRTLPLTFGEAVLVEHGD